jgi:hypothetical protein
VESVFAFSQSVIYRTEQIEISIWPEPAPPINTTEAERGLRPHVSVGDVQLQKKTVEVESKAYTRRREFPQSSD